MSRITEPLAILLGELPGLTRLALAKLLAATPHVRVVGTALSGEDLVLKARTLRPDLVIAGEAVLPGLGLLARHSPVPVLLYANSIPLPGMMQEAARWGVYDYLSPLLPEGHPMAAAQHTELRRKVQMVRPKQLISRLGKTATSIFAPPRGIIVLGGSTGGASAVERVVQGLTPSLRQAILVAVHLPAQFTNSFVERLRRISPFPVEAACAGSRLEAGRILVAPGGHNMVVRPVTNGPWLAWQTEFAADSPGTSDVPSVDMLMSSAARAMGRKVMGVVLSGLGRDGALGAQAVRQQGGVVIAQDEASAAVFGMPKAVIQGGFASQVLPLNEISDFINRSMAPVVAPRPSRYSLSQATNV
ncbi:chemotaxis protein CheB [Hymenobacter sp. BT730]|uniref:chemotaxis protein CheB n=1 Tax=Hymenobacter sp. BT730 TaxID=3063332 RepID=UPI0026E0D405|nr:chemotaxis protein CheB [Hymenobacter sp. BT730]